VILARGHQRPLQSFFVASLLVACGSETQQTRDGVADVNIADREWSIAGSCITDDDDTTFNGPGDPWLSIGFDSAGTASAVGNLRAQKTGFSVIVGSPDAPKPLLTISGNTYSVAGKFLALDGTLVDGQIMVVCE
jgi:hypothetical protein